MTESNKKRIAAKVELGLPLTAFERAYYLLYIATAQQTEQFLAAETNSK